MFKHKYEGLFCEAFSTGGKVNHALLFLLEIVSKEGLEVERPASQNHLVALDLEAIYFESDV